LRAAPLVSFGFASAAAAYSAYIERAAPLLMDAA
jgi:hypothetical protein